MTIDLDLGEQQEALMTSVRGFCQRQLASPRPLERGVFPREEWLRLAELGVLGLVTPEMGGGALDLVCAVRELGRAGFPGPLAATAVATQLLDGADLDAVVGGTAIVSVGAPPVMPWAPHADVLIELDGDRAWRVAAAGDVQAVDTLAGEAWGMMAVERTSELGDARRALALGDLTTAAYLVGAGFEAAQLAADYARERIQFGRPIGDFQAVAHPLADALTRLLAAEQLVFKAAVVFDDMGDDVHAAASARLSATRGALDAVYAAHQTFGAMGFTVEGPIGRLGQQARQVSLAPPGPNRARAIVRHGTLSRETSDPGRRP